MTEALQGKQCVKCKLQKPFTDFCRMTSSPDGHQSYCKVCEKEWAENNREKRRAAVSRWEKRNPKRKRCNEGYQARRMVQSALKSGRLLKPDACEECNRITPKPQLHGHHEDYSKPLEVEWLCQGCHYQRHGKTLGPVLS